MVLTHDTDRQAFMAELVEHVEHPILASVMGAVLDEVVGLDMIALLRAQPHARSVGQPEPAALGLLRWDLQPLASPDTLDPLVVDYPARLPQQFGDLAIAVAAVLPGKLDNIGRETWMRGAPQSGFAMLISQMSWRMSAGVLGQPPRGRDFLRQ